MGFAIATGLNIVSRNLMSTFVNQNALLLNNPRTCRHTPLHSTIDLVITHPNCDNQIMHSKQPEMKKFWISESQ